jgi:hypothetical protein
MELESLYNAVRSNKYETKLSYKTDRAAARVDQDLLLLKFMNDLRVALRGEGVPDQYIAKVASLAWQEGHSFGFSEVLNHASNLTEIFQ